MRQSCQIECLFLLCRLSQRAGWRAVLVCFVCLFPPICCSRKCAPQVCSSFLQAITKSASPHRSTFTLLRNFFSRRQPLPTTYPTLPSTPPLLAPSCRVTSAGSYQCRIEASSKSYERLLLLRFCLISRKQSEASAGNRTVEKNRRRRWRRRNPRTMRSILFRKSQFSVCSTVQLIVEIIDSD